MLKAPSKMLLLAFCLRAIMEMSNMNPYKRREGNVGEWSTEKPREERESQKLLRGVFYHGVFCSA